ncbi:MAG: hypothetical protein ONB46_17920 [candidate division KSB1 bacterium]|nr:hypothetical protein [candidate division KSB1 bacterium]
MLVDKYAAKLKKSIEANSVKSEDEDSETPVANLGGPIGDDLWWGTYKFWDVYAVGPIQFGVPPFKPNKIIAGGEDFYFLVYVVTNPLLINGTLPSATTLVAGRPYRLRLETFNLTNGVPGPYAEINSVFPGSPLQAFLFGFTAAEPQEGRAELLEVNVTADVTDNTHQPMAAFATYFLDLDFDPGFPLGPAQSPHMHAEQPLRCLCYKR